MAYPITKPSKHPSRLLSETDSVSLIFYSPGCGGDSTELGLIGMDSEYPLGAGVRSRNTVRLDRVGFGRGPSISIRNS